MKNKEQNEEKWDIVEYMGFSGHYRSLGETFTSLEDVTNAVRKLNQKTLGQTSFFIRDLTSESGNLSDLKRG